MAQNANPSIRTGNKKYEKQDYTQAEIEYRKGLQEDKKSTESYYNLGNSLYQQSKYQEAAKEFEKAWLAPIATRKRPWHTTTWAMPCIRPKITEVV